MYAFGYIFVIIILIILFRSGGSFERMFFDFLIMELVFSINRINMGYFIKIGGSELEYNDVLLGILFILSLVIFAQRGLADRKLFNSSMALLGIIFLGIVLLIAFPSEVKVMDYSHSWDYYFRGDTSQLTQVKYTSQTILMTFRVIIFLFILNISKVLLDRDDWINIGGSVLKISNVLIIYGIVEVIAKFGLHFNISSYLITYMGRGVSTGGGVDRLQGFCREPSYYSLALFNFIILTLIMNRIKGNNRISDYKWVIAAVAIGIISTSFSFLICLVAVAVAFYLISGEKFAARSRVILTGGIVLLIVMLVLFMGTDLTGLISGLDSEGWLSRILTSIDVIQKSITDTLVLGKDYSSEAARLGGAILSIKAGLTRPLFGLGLGTVYCVAGLPSIFANTGFFGLLVWIYCVFFCYPEKANKSVCFILLIPVIFCNDLYTLYDTSYVLLVPLMCLMFDNIRNELGVEIDE